MQEFCVFVYMHIFIEKGSVTKKKKKKKFLNDLFTQGQVQKVSKVESPGCLGMGDPL